MRSPGVPIAGAGDAVLAVGSVLVLGLGVVLTLTGAARDELVVIVGGALLGMTGLTIALAAGWIDGLLLVAVSIPLPALAGDDEIRLAAVAPLTALVVVAWFVARVSLRQRARLDPFPRASLAVLGATFVIATLFAQNYLIAVRELLNIGVLLGLLVVATDLLRRRPERIERLVTWLVAVAGVTGALAVLETGQILPGEFERWGTPFNRAALGFGQPNGLGVYLALIFPLAVHRVTVSRPGLPRWLGLAAAGAIFLGLGGTFSRGSWLSVGMGVCALFAVGQARPALRLWALGAAAAIFADVVSGGMLRDTFQRTIGDWLLEQRAALMFAGVLVFLAYPVIGVGPGGFAVSLDRFGPQITQLIDYKPTPHNAYIQMAAETGVVGLVALLWFLWCAWSILARQTRAAVSDPHVSDATRSLHRAVVWSFATAVLAGLSMWPLAHGPGQVMMLVLAIGFASSSRTRP